ALIRLRSALPGIEVALAVEHTVAPVEALKAGDIDVAMLTSGPVDDPAIESAPLFADEVVFAVAPGHALAGRRALTRKDLLEHALIATHAPKPEARWFAQRVYGRGPRGRIELLPLTEAVVDLARAGLGVAVLSEWVAEPHLGR